MKINEKQSSNKPLVHAILKYLHLSKIFKYLACTWDVTNKYFQKFVNNLIKIVYSKEEKNVSTHNG